MLETIQIIMIYFDSICHINAIWAKKVVVKKFFQLTIPTGGLDQSPQVSITVDHTQLRSSAGQPGHQSLFEMKYIF